MDSGKTDEGTTRPDDRIERVVVKPRQRPTLQVPLSELQHLPAVSLPSDSDDPDTLPIEPDDTFCDASDVIIEPDVTFTEPDVTISDPDVTIDESDVPVDEPSAEEIQSHKDESDAPSHRDISDIENSSEGNARPKDNNSDALIDDSNFNGVPADLSGDPLGLKNTAEATSVPSEDSHVQPDTKSDPKSGNDADTGDFIPEDSAENKLDGDGLGSKSPSSWVTFDNNPVNFEDGINRKEDNNYQRASPPNNTRPDPKCESKNTPTHTSFDPLDSNQQSANPISNKPESICDTPLDSPTNRLNTDTTPGTDSRNTNLNNSTDSQAHGHPTKNGDGKGSRDPRSPAVVVVAQPRRSGGAGVREQMEATAGETRGSPAEPAGGRGDVDSNRSRASSHVSLTDTDSLLPKHAQWSTGLCQCPNSCGEVCYSGSCMPCATYQLASSLGQTDAHGPLCCLQCYLGDLRTRLRHRFGIRGNDDNDCCITYWCTSCAIAQMRRELRIRANQ